MAHDVKDQGPYPALKAAFEAIDHPGFVLIKDPGGLYLSEDISEDPEILAQTTCLFLQWAMDEMRQQYGREKLVVLIEALRRGINHTEKR